MRRDEAIYAYGGQQLAAGVRLYRGIFDPKTPLVLWGSLLGATVFALFRSPALDAVGGPDAKTPGSCSRWSPWRCSCGGDGSGGRARCWRGGGGRS